jgi:hypothetical protein
MNSVFTAIGKAWGEGVVWFVNSAPWYVQLLIPTLALIAMISVILKILDRIYR